MFFWFFFLSFFIILPPQIRKIRVIVDYFLLKSKSQSSVIYQGRIYNVVCLPSGTAEQTALNHVASILIVGEEKIYTTVI